jgi:hypothetical protein
MLTRVDGNGASNPERREGFPALGAYPPAVSRIPSSETGASVRHAIRFARAAGTPSIRS